MEWSIEELGEESFVIVTDDTDRVNRYRNRDIKVISGNPSDEQPLHDVAIEHARAVVAATNDDADDAFYELTLQPPGDFVPALSLRYMNLDIDGQAETSGTGLPLIGGGSSSRQDINADIDDLELASYYRYRLPAGFGLELGGAIKRLDGEIVARDADTGQEVDRHEVDVIFPLLLGAVRYQPRDWLSARISARGISARGDSVSEYRAEVGVRPWSWLTVTGGYWRKDYDVEDSDLDLDLTLEGPFLAVSAGF
jgi:hypothetical protein